MGRRKSLARDANAGAALVVNGRFLSARATGVQRVAAALLHQLGDRRDELDALFPGGVRIEAPHGTAATAVAGIPVHITGRMTGQLWEQVALPWCARDAVILSLSNAGPIAARRGITMIHDAQSYTMPESYSRAFVRWYRFMLPRLGRRNLGILTVSAYSARELTAFGVAAAEHVTVVPNGVDHVLDFARDDAIGDRLGLGDARYVVALATTQAHKNIDILLRAFAAADLGDMKLVLIGPAGRERFEALAAPIPASVVFAGMVSDAGLRSLIEGAVCFAMPSRTEGFGLPPLEAMLLGTPAVVSPCGALPEVCGDAALYADPDAPQQWGAAFRALATDEALRARMIALGRAQASRFTWAAAGRTLIDTLRGVAGRPSP